MEEIIILWYQRTAKYHLWEVLGDKFAEALRETRLRKIRQDTPQGATYSGG